MHSNVLRDTKNYLTRYKTIDNDFFSMKHTLSVKFPQFCLISGNTFVLMVLSTTEIQLLKII